MTPELEQQLITKYPRLFKDVNAPMTETCICWGVETGDGWYDLIDQACQKITEVDPNAYFTQIKEKYGTLRMYLVGNDAAQDAAEYAESQSSRICEKCSSTEDVTTSGGWLQTLCKNCREKRVCAFFL